MAKYHTKIQSERKVRAWGTRLATWLLIAISFSQSGLAQAVDASADKIQRAKKIIVSNLHHGIDNGVGRDPIVEVCKPFRMSIRQVEYFFRLAKSISKEEFDHNHDWLPCYASGRPEADQTSFDWKISASGVAKVWLRSNEN